MMVSEAGLSPKNLCGQMWPPLLCAAPLAIPNCVNYLFIDILDLMDYGLCCLHNVI